MFSQSLVTEIYIAAFHAPGHESAVCILYDFIGFLGSKIMLGFYFGFEAFHRLIVPGTSRDICDDAAVLVPHVRTDDDSYVVYFKTLAGMYAAYLLNRIFFNDPKVLLGVKIPFFFKLYSGIVISIAAGSFLLFQSQWLYYLPGFSPLWFRTIRWDPRRCGNRSLQE